MTDSWEDTFGPMAEMVLSLQDLRNAEYPESIADEMQHLFDKVVENLEPILELTDPSVRPATAQDYIHVGAVISLLNHAQWVVEKLTFPS